MLEEREEKEKERGNDEVDDVIKEKVRSDLATRGRGWRNFYHYFGFCVDGISINVFVTIITATLHLH